MTNALNNNISTINSDDLTRPSSDAKYTVGQILSFIDKATPNPVKKYMYVKSHGALTQYQPYQVVAGSVAGSEVLTKAPGTIAGGATIGVPQVAVTSGYYAFVQVAGFCSAKTTGSSANGDHLKIINAGAGLIVDGSTGSTTISEKSVAVQKGAAVANVATVNLIGNLGSSLISAS